MPYINLVSAQILIEGPDELLGSLRCPADHLEPWTRSEKPKPPAPGMIHRGIGGIFPPYQRAFLMKHILQEMPVLKCALISGFTCSERY